MGLFKIPRHGRSHRPGRSDTIPGVIVFNYLNEDDAGYLWAQALAVTLTGLDHVTAVSTGDMTLASNEGLDIHDILTGIGVIGISIASQADIRIWSAPDGAKVRLGFVPDSGAVEHPAIETTNAPASGSPGVQVRIAPSATLLVTDRNGNALFKVDSAGNLHGKTGKTLAFDL